MAAATKRLGEHVLAALTAGGFSQTFTATRSYQTLLDREDLSGLTVNVLCWVQDGRVTTRAGAELPLVLNVEVAQALDGRGMERCDELSQLMEEIGLAALTLPDLDGFRMVPPDAECPLFAPQFDPELLAQEDLFFGVVSARFVCARSLG